MDFRRPGLIARLSLPLRGIGQLFMIVSLMVAGFAFMILGNSGAVFVERLRTNVADIATPILQTLAAPVAAFNSGIDNIRELASLRSENVRLREEVERLRAWQGAAYKLTTQNQTLRGMLNYHGPQRYGFITGRVIADGRGPFVKSVLINAGSRIGVAKGQGVIATGGLAGRVIEAGTISARILLITDLNSRIPVIVEGSGVRAILSGDNSPRPRLQFVPEINNLDAGQRIVTSGHGGVLPAGLPVGRIHAVKDGVFRVQPFVNLDRLEYLQIVDFNPIDTPRSGPRDATVTNETEGPGK
ncbi:MAG: rod shape-determining protein MreC [Alphaproteobacteria bacterium]|nr:rod shape-determining protein MreC [Alphaproteobacteria bacterium]